MGIKPSRQINGGKGEETVGKGKRKKNVVGHQREEKSRPEGIE